MRQMTITHADFFRILPKALGSDQYQRDGNRISFIQPACSMTINVSPERRWQIAGLELPVTDVEIIIEGCSEEETISILKRFELSFQKGGG